jgi:hypothetical protein
MLMASSLLEEQANGDGRRRLNLQPLHINEEIALEIPRDKLLLLLQDYVVQATGMVREQERLLDQIRGEAVDSPFIQRALEAVAKASGAVLAQKALVRELKEAI